MIYTPLTIKALNFAYLAHAGIPDRSGIPYIFHPYHLAEQMSDEITAAIALLHDILEDTPITIKDLELQGFPKEVINAVYLLTREPGVPYMEYIIKLKNSGNINAIKVKIADLNHNSDLSRLPKITDRDIERMKKYHKALSLLTSINNNSF